MKGMLVRYACKKYCLRKTRNKGPPVVLGHCSKTLALKVLLIFLNYFDASIYFNLLVLCEGGELN